MTVQHIDVAARRVMRDVGYLEASIAERFMVTHPERLARADAMLSSVEQDVRRMRTLLGTAIQQRTPTRTIEGSTAP